MATDLVKEYSEFTGITEGYAEEILADAEYAKWHLPSGAAKLEEAAALVEAIDAADDETPVDPEAGAGEGEDTGDGSDLDGDKDNTDDDVTGPTGTGPTLQGPVFDEEEEDGGEVIGEE